MSTASKQAKHAGVAIVAPTSIPYERKTEQPATYFIGSAFRAMLSSAKLEKKDCDGMLIASFSLAPNTVASLADSFDMSLNWAEQIPLGGAAGAVGLRRGARAIENGDAQVVACIGGDTFLPELFINLLGRFTNATMDAVTPYANGGANAQFALLTRTYMDTYGVTREDFGKICVMQRNNSLAYEQALFNKPLTMEQYISARVVAEPLGLFDCVMPCAGAEGYLLMSVERAEALNIPYAVVSASAERHNHSRLSDSPLEFGWIDYRDDLYNAADLEPADIDIAQVYDDYPVMVARQLEELGLCPDGQATHRISETGLSRQGKNLYVNTSGGQLSSGQAGYAGGFMGIVEAARQLTGRGLGNQLESPESAIISGFGMVNFDRGLSTAAAILKRGKV